jgi:DNA-directed RNA polymerase alpha subunit
MIILLQIKNPMNYFLNRIVLIFFNISKSKSDTVLAKQNYQSDPRILNLDIGNLDLTLAPYSLLKQANINTINDLILPKQNSRNSKFWAALAKSNRRCIIRLKFKI